MKAKTPPARPTPRDYWIRAIRAELDRMKREAEDDHDLIVACASNHSGPAADPGLVFFATESFDSVSIGALAGETVDADTLVFPLRFVRLGNSIREDGTWYYEAEIDVPACVDAAMDGYNGRTGEDTK